LITDLPSCFGKIPYPTKWVSENYTSLPLRCEECELLLECAEATHKNMIQKYGEDNPSLREGVVHFHVNNGKSVWL